MRGVRGATSGRPRTPVLSGRRHATVDAADGPDQQAVTAGEPHDEHDEHDEPRGPHGPEDEEHRVSIEEHRETVVRRLLARGLSPNTVVALLPDFGPVVERVAEDD